MPLELSLPGQQKLVGDLRGRKTSGGKRTKVTIRIAINNSRDDHMEMTKKAHCAINPAAAGFVGKFLIAKYLNRI